jgi:uncharacterized protein YceK
MKNLLNLVMLALLLLATGCGSLGSRWRGGTGAYQGVRFDCEQVAHHSTESEFIAVADIPLSAIVDTLFLPYDLATEEREKLESAGVPTTASTGAGRVGYK